MQFTTTLRNSLLQAVKDAVGTGATFAVYTGSSPGVGNTATGTLLATLTAVTLGTPSAAAMSISATADSSGDASGTPGYCRLTGGTGGTTIDFTAAVGSGDANFGGTVSLGGSVSMTSGSITAGNS